MNITSSLRALAKQSKQWFFKEKPYGLLRRAAPRNDGFLKTLCLCASVVFLSLTAQATEISNDTANQYYQNCIAGTTPPELSKQTQDTLCACTAAQMKTGFTMEDMQAMSKKDETARLALNKMIVNVYAPCIQYPAYDYYYNVCVSNPQTASLSKNPQALCSCLAQKVSSYLAQNSQQVFADILTRTPNIVDPMAALTSDPQFDHFAQGQLVSCVQ